MVEDKIAKAPAHIHTIDMKYYLEGKWKCECSPTKAHHWESNGTQTAFVCKYCKERRENVDGY